MVTILEINNNNNCEKRAICISSNEKEEP